jgi:hypothetical protein
MLSFRLDNALNGPFAVRPEPGGLGHEQHADAILARRRQVDAALGANRAQMGVRYLDEDSGAIAGARIRADGAPVGEAFQELQTLADDLVAFPVLYVGDKADAARIVLVARVVEPLFLG